MYDKNTVIDFLRKHYPNEKTEKICSELGLTLSTVYTLARRNNIKKSDEYLKKLHIELMKCKEEKYLASIPEISLTELEQNVIVGSILGDGNLTFAPRSRNAYYREHFSIKQKEYREWKMNSITSMKFRIEKECHLKSPSHPIFTELYDKFYINGVKTITENNIKLLNHPIGLACLYMDDGTLMVSASKSKTSIYVHSSVAITTLCFSKSECEILADHILKTFGILFNISSFPQGKGWNLRISKIEEIINFFNVITPFCMEVPCLTYKWNMPSRLENKKQDLIKIYKDKYIIKTLSACSIPNFYSEEEIKLICNLKKKGKKYKEIAKLLGRSYDSVAHKISDLKKQDKI